MSHERVGVAVRGAHSLLHDGADLLSDRCRRTFLTLCSFRPVDHEERFAGDVEAALSESHEQLLHDRRVLGVALFECERDLGEVDSVDHDDHEIDTERSALMRSLRADSVMATKRRETADLDVA